MQGVRVTRSKANSSISDQNVLPTRNKRKAEQSPLRNGKVKRSALGNLTNAAVEQLADTKLASMIQPVKKAIKCAVHGKKGTKAKEVASKNKVSHNF